MTDDRNDDSAASALVDGLVQLSYAVQAVLGRLADEQGLSVIALRMLAVLEDREIGMQRLAAILELEKSSVTGLVDRAERRGQVRRIAVPEDRRTVHVVVTEAGRALLRTVRAAVRDELDQLTAGLTPAHRGQLARHAATVVGSYIRRHDLPV